MVEVVTVMVGAVSSWVDSVFTIGVLLVVMVTVVVVAGVSVFSFGVVT